SITKDTHLSHDIVQETFIKAFKHIDRVKEPNKIGAWLSVIASRTSLDVLKKHKNHSSILVDLNKKQTEVVPENECDKFIMKLTVREKINELSPQHRVVIMLKYIKDMKETEIAENIGISIGTVKSRLNRAKIKLKK